MIRHCRACWRIRADTALAARERGNEAGLAEIAAGSVVGVAALINIALY
jgi:hypothetical protein